MPLVLAIFEVLGRPAEDNDQAAALEKQMLRRSYFTFIQTVAGSGMNEVMANQGELPTSRRNVRLWSVHVKNFQMKNFRIEFSRKFLTLCTTSYLILPLN